jgi:hypothetical protein
MTKVSMHITIRHSDKPETTHPVRQVSVPDDGEFKGYTAMISTFSLYAALTTYDEEFINDECEEIDSRFAGYVEESELVNLSDADLLSALDLQPRTKR